MQPVKKIVIKILVLGPLKSGKTSIANYLAESEYAIPGDYRPTHGVRIVEFESNQLELEGESVNAEVELWDCSGDRSFADCWPAIRYKSSGAIFVFNPETNTGADLLPWYNEFALKGAINRKNLIVVAHSPSSEHVEQTSTLADFELPSEMSDIACIRSNIEQNGEELRLEFNNFLCNIIANARDDY